MYVCMYVCVYIADDIGACVCMTACLFVEDRATKKKKKGKERKGKEARAPRGAAFSEGDTCAQMCRQTDCGRAVLARYMDR